MGNYLHLFNTVSEYTEARESEYIEPWVSYTLENEEVNFNKSEYEKLLETPLTFEITSGGNITWSYYDNVSSGEYEDAHATIYYKKNDDTGWTEMSRTLAVVSGDTIQFKGDNDAYCDADNYDNYDSFSEATTAGFTLKGNIMSLIDSTGFTTATTLVSSYTFNFLFSNCTGLTSAENLILPATTLAYDCYGSMFLGCTSLTEAPELPATTLANNCYQSMFRGCTNLTTAPELPATTLANNCYYYMFYGCTSLTTAPELPATTLASGCYYGMFNGCTNLNYIKCLATNISASSSRNNWVSGVQTTSGTFVKAAGISESTWGRGTSGIPTNWTVQNA